MWECKSYDKNKEATLVKLGKGRLLSRLLAERDLDPIAIDDFLNPDYKGLSHPYALNDMEKATRLFCEVAKCNGKVACIGDYDCDGIISSVMIKELCTVFGIDCSVFLPSRMDHGYGLNKLTLEAFFKKINDVPDLLFVVDCGTNSKDEIEEMYKRGVKHVIVIDHHLPSDKIATNATALISWHLSKESNCREMCSCGETFQFIRGVRWLTKKINPIEFLTYAAIGTIADVSPIIGDNRIIVKNGLTDYALNHVIASGLKALMKQCKIYTNSLTQQDVSFKLAPKINAVGRIYYPDIVYGMMIERDPEIAKNTADYVIGYNEERKKIQKDIEDEAISMAESQKNENGILVYNEKWHIGVVGIVASRLVELFGKPSIVVGKNGDLWKGSGRSIKGINIKEILDVCPEIFEAYGGHSGAVGVTLKDKTVVKANKVFDKACKKYYLQKSIPQSNTTYYDAKIDIPLIVPETSLMLRNNLYPYCNENNSEPIFMIPQATIIDVNIIEKEFWRLVTFYVERNGKKCPHPFKFFTKKFGTEIEGMTADVYFTFPQHDNFEATRFSQFELYANDIFCKDAKEKG